MIDSATANALDRLDARNSDVRNAYVAGFVPLENDTTRASRVAPSTDPLNVALPDSAFVLTRDSGGNVAYSRDGAFHVTAGELRASDGRPLLGFVGDNRKTLMPLRVDPYDAALGRVTQERVEADGSVCYTRTTIDPRTGEHRAERITLGRIALARFPAGTQTERIDAEHVRPPAGVSPQLGLPADGTFPAVATKSRDLGRVDILAGLEKMKEAYDHYEALRAAHHGRGQTEKIAMDLVK